MARPERSSCRFSPGTRKAEPALRPAGHRGPGSACRRWCNPQPAHLPRGSCTSEFGFLCPALAAPCALSLRPPEALACTGLVEVPAGSPRCPQLNTGGPRCQLGPGRSPLQGWLMGLQSQSRSEFRGLLLLPLPPARPNRISQPRNPFGSVGRGVGSFLGSPGSKLKPVGFTPLSPAKSCPLVSSALGL